MTRVDFYLQPGQDGRQRYNFACKLTEKAYRMGLKVQIQTETEDEDRLMDDLLWTFRQGSFIPHARADAPVQERAGVPVLIGRSASADETIDLLINLAATVPQALEQYSRIAELLNDDETVRLAGRDRFRRYKALGFEIETHHLTG